MLWSLAASGSAAMVNESAREIPVAYDVDVVVAGGSLAAVSAAVEAARAGAKVFLAAPRPYLGEDVCATFRLWLEPGEEPDSPLERALFAPPSPPLEIGRGLPFTYTADLPSDKAHRDSDPPGMLSDGKAGSAVSQSVQYNGNVTIVADLGDEIALGRVHVLAYQRASSFELARVTVALSTDGEQWVDAGACDNAQLGRGEFLDNALLLTLPVAGRARYVKVTAEKTPNASRVLLGEIIIEAEGAATGAPAPDRRIPPMPMQVKRVLDEALLDAGVEFLYGCYPTDVLRDADGSLAGLIMANRSGRQAVRAKCIIDATPRAAVARMAGAVFRPQSGGTPVFRRVVIGQELTPAEGLAARKLPAPLQLEQGGWSGNVFCDAYEYTLELPLRDDSFSALAEAEQAARDRTWSPKQLMSSESLFQVPAAAIVGRVTSGGAAGEPVPVEAFQPQGVDRLYVLGGCADVPRERAEALLRPLTFLDAGARVGWAAAEAAKPLPVPSEAHVPGTPAESPAPGDIHEVLTGVRPIQSGLPVVASAARGVPVLGEYDVVVVGGGTGGAPAGISAARQGAKTLVIEYLDGLGGVGTLGLIGSYYYGFLKGFTEEVDLGVAALGGQEKPASPSWNVEWKMEWYRRELRKAGADVWFGVLGCGTVMEGHCVKGVVVATPDGRGVVLAKNVIDATGNADVAFAAGAECMTTGADHAGVQGTGMPPRRPGQSYTNTDYTITDDADVVDAWRTYLGGRSKYREAFDLGVIIDSRERRRIVGDTVVSPLDIWNQRTYPDTIGLSRSNFDTHGFTVHALFALQFPEKQEVFAYTPYRALLPKGVDGLLVTGLGLSAHRDAMPILRMQGDIQNQGYAAGLAAAMAAQAGVTPRAIDIKALQRQLVDKGNVPESVLSDADSYPMPRERVEAAVHSVVNNYDGASVLLAQPEDALPLLRGAYTAAETEDARRIYAHVLGMLEDLTGADALVKAVAGQPWDSGWSFTGGGQFGGSLSPLDSLLVALARTGDPRGLDVILQKAALLDATSAFSHHRAVAIALETLGRSEAASVLAAVLAKPGMTGYALANVAAAKAAAELPNPNQDRDRSIRELLLARALYRCGDHEGVAAGILNAYAQDWRGHLARHARGILQGASAPAAPEDVSRMDIEIRPRGAGKQ
jgi:flavin-dependent dehydrogenase